MVMRELNAKESQFIADLYKAHYDKLLNYAMQFLEKSNAEEAVQNAFADACVKIDTIMNCENPAAWLGQALKYSIQKIRRTKGQFANLMIYMPPKADAEFGMEMGMEDFPDIRPKDEDVDFLYSNLALHEEFQLIKRYAVEDKSIKNIAEEDNISLDACKKRLVRAKRKLKIWLNKQKG